MGSVVKGLDHAMQTMNLEEVCCATFLARLCTNTCIHMHTHARTCTSYGFNLSPISQALGFHCFGFCVSLCNGLKISTVMDKFESQFEELDVHSKTLEDGIGATMHTTAPEEQIDALLQEVRSVCLCVSVCVLVYVCFVFCS